MNWASVNFPIIFRISAMPMELNHSLCQRTSVCSGFRTV